MKLRLLRAGAAESTTEGVVSDGGECAVASDPVLICIAVGDSGDIDVAARAFIHDTSVLSCAFQRPCLQRFPFVLTLEHI